MFLSRVLQRREVRLHQLVEAEDGLVVVGERVGRPAALVVQLEDLGLDVPLQDLGVELLLGGELLLRDGPQNVGEALEGHHRLLDRGLPEVEQPPVVTVVARPRALRRVGAVVEVEVVGH
jgi:hypothetical protein